MAPSPTTPPGPRLRDLSELACNPHDLGASPSLETTDYFTPVRMDIGSIPGSVNRSTEIKSNESVSIGSSRGGRETLFQP